MGWSPLAATSQVHFVDDSRASTRALEVLIWHHVVLLHMPSAASLIHQPANYGLWFESAQLVLPFLTRLLWTITYGCVPFGNKTREDKYASRKQVTVQEPFMKALKPSESLGSQTTTLSLTLTLPLTARPPLASSLTRGEDKELLALVDFDAFIISI